MRAGKRGAAKNLRLFLQQLLLWRVCTGEHTCTITSAMGDMGDLSRRVCRMSSACQRIQHPAQTVGLTSVIAVQPEANGCHIVKSYSCASGFTADDGNCYTKALLELMA